MLLVMVLVLPMENGEPSLVRTRVESRCASELRAGVESADEMIG